MLDAIFSLNTVWWALMGIYVPACLGLIGIVLLQQGKGGGLGGALGGGAGPGADTVFGPKSQSMPVKITYAGATLFMTIAIVLSVLSGRLDKGAAPELVQTSDGDPTTQVSNNSKMSALGLGTGITKDSAHDESAPEAAPVVTIEPTPEATEESTEEDASDATE